MTLMHGAFFVQVLGSRCNDCGREWESWQLSIADAPVPLKLHYPFTIEAKAFRHFLVAPVTKNDCECGGRIEWETRPE